LAEENLDDLMNPIINYDEFARTDKYINSYASKTSSPITWNTDTKYSLAIVYFRAGNESIKVEREGYSLFDLFGDLGGVIEILGLILGSVVD